LTIKSAQHTQTRTQGSQPGARRPTPAFTSRPGSSDHRTPAPRATKPETGPDGN